MYVMQKHRNPRRPITRATKFCTAVPNIVGPYYELAPCQLSGA